MRRVLAVTFLLVNFCGAWAQTAPTYTAISSIDTQLTTSFLQGSDGNFYGLGPSFETDYIEFFQITPSGTVTFKNFNASNIDTLCSVAPGGYFYAYGYNATGEYGIEEVSLQGSVSMLAVTPNAEEYFCPTLGSDGNLYGMNAGGGAYNAGYIYMITPAGAVKTLYDFTGTAVDGSGGGQLLQASNGYFYGGSTAGLFRYSVAEGLTVLGPSAFYPLNFSTGFAFVEASDGNFYGTTGDYQNPSQRVIRITPEGTVSTIYTPPTTTGISNLFLADNGGSLYLQEFTESTNTCGIGSTLSVVPLSLSGTVGSTYFGLGQPSDGNDAYFAYASMLIAGNGNFYGGWTNEADTFNPQGQGECSDYPYVNTFFSEVPEATPTPPIEMSLSETSILLGKSTTLTWKVNDAYSLTAQQCYGYGELSGKLALSGTQTFTPTEPGVYTAGIVCGGTQAAAVQLSVSTTQLTLTPSLTSINAGQPDTLTATITNDGTPVATGTVKFLYGTTVLGTATVNSSGVATYTANTTGIPVGTYNITASYSGDANYPATTSAAVAITVIPRAVTATSLGGSSTDVNPGATVTLTSDISYSTQPLPTGNVTLTVGTTVLQTVTLPGTSDYGNFEQIAFSASTTGIAPGTYGLTANYAGDIYNAPSTSGVVDITIKSPNTAVVSATPSPVPANTAFTLSSTVAGKVGTPTGTVFFYAGTKEVASSILNSSGVASIVVPSGTLAAATYPITAVYAGDNNNVGVTSPAISLTIE